MNYRFLSHSALLVLTLWIGVASVRAEPNLVSAELKTKTKDGGDDKDHDTGVFVLVTAADAKTVLAKVADADNTVPYHDGSSHVLNVPIAGQKIPKSRCEHFKYNIGIMARGGFLGSFTTSIGLGDEKGTMKFNGPSGGNDKWDFDAWLVLHFSDGSTLMSDKLRQELESNGGKVKWLNLQ